MTRKSGSFYSADATFPTLIGNPYLRGIMVKKPAKKAAKKAVKANKTAAKKTAVRAKKEVMPVNELRSAAKAAAARRLHK